MTFPSKNFFLRSTLCFGLVACGGQEEKPEPDPAPAVDPAPVPVRPVAEVDSRPPPMHEPVDKWAEGAVEGQVDAAKAADEGHILLDLGEEWTPYIFTERDTPTSERFEHGYRPTYLALAAGEFPDDHHGARARRDKYLELYGILPALGVLRDRMKATSERACAADLKVDALTDFKGFVAYRNNNQARRNLRTFLREEKQVEAWVEGQGVETAGELDRSGLSRRDERTLDHYLEEIGKVRAIRETQDRLVCEGYFEGKGEFLRGALDWVTHEALAEFERRHRVYGWGYIGRDTLPVLRRAPMENEREAVIRVLTERAVHAAGIIEDASSPNLQGEPPTYLGADGARRPIPNLEGKIREQVIAAFGLETPESALAFLEGLGDIPAKHTVAINGVELPEYYNRDMPLAIRIDRGDVWYEFPFDEEGNERSQRVVRRPRLSVVTRYNNEDVVLARFGTTIGGWRSESVEGNEMWKYKNSPVGPRIWHQIVAAPVWMPPEGTPVRGLLSRHPGGSGRNAYRVNYHEMGPSYASAYGLVAAYHRLYRENDDGTYTLRGDEGIRTHGSVDYMSIMRRHSHGCHRLHNHLAVRLMSFVLAHRAHKREGQQRIGFGRNFEYKGHRYSFNLEQGGYVFALEEPIRVSVLAGRIRGAVSRPIETPLPKYDPESEGYFTPEGAKVSIDRFGRTTELEAAPPDGGLLDGAIDGAVDGGAVASDAGRPDGGVPESSDKVPQGDPEPKEQDQP